MQTTIDAIDVHYALIDAVTQELVGRYPTHSQAMAAAMARGMHRHGQFQVVQQVMWDND